MTDDANAPTIPEPPSGVSSAADASSPDARYALRRVLGKGGMGEVWLAHDFRVDREIAIKLMRGGGKDSDLVGRFLREARVQGRLEHPGIVPVHDLGGTDGSTPYFAMKRLTGTTLADVIAARDAVKWPRRTLLARFVDICLAVEFAHQRGVVHRDLKPANLMLGDFGETYVLDWGLARLVGEGDGEQDVMRQSDLRGDSGVGPQTEAGAMLGTPGYMSPEQMRGDEIDRRTDVYALGCILFEILAGSPANPRASAIDSTLSSAEHRPTKRAADVPPELDEACARATAADVGKRLDSARALADLVQNFLDGDRDLARRRELATAHVAKAQELSATGDKGRVDAIREAGSAIALDVDNKAAQQLLARLLLEPPENMPAGALKSVEEERRQAGHVVMRYGAVSYFFFLIAIPFVALMGISKLWPMVLVFSEVVVLMSICLYGLRRKLMISSGFATIILTGHSILLATIGLMLGPLLVTPTLIFGSATIAFTIPSIHMPKRIAIAHLLVVLVPLTLELAGAVPRTFAIVDHRLVLEPWALAFSPGSIVVVIVGAAILQMIGNMLVLDAQRTAQVRAEEKVHAQKWQLEQLVPSSGPST